MLCMTGMESREKHRSAADSGMISSCFLGIMLFVTAAVTAGAYSQKKKNEAMIHLKKAQEYQSAESVVMSEIRCGLLNHDLKEGMHVQKDVYFTVKAEETAVYVTIEDPVQETMEISYSPDTLHVTGFHAERY